MQTKTVKEKSVINAKKRKKWQMQKNKKTKNAKASKEQQTDTDYLLGHIVWAPQVCDQGT